MVIKIQNMSSLSPTQEDTTAQYMPYAREQDHPRPIALRRPYSSSSSGYEPGALYSRVSPPMPSYPSYESPRSKYASATHIKTEEPEQRRFNYPHQRHTPPPSSNAIQQQRGDIERPPSARYKIYPTQSSISSYPHLREGHDSPRGYDGDARVAPPTSFLRASVGPIARGGGGGYDGHGSSSSTERSGLPGVSAILRESEERRGGSSSSASSSSSIPHVARVMQALRRQESNDGRGGESPFSGRGSPSLYHREQLQQNGGGPSSFLLRHRNQYDHLKRSRGEQEWGSYSNHPHHPTTAASTAYSRHPSFNNHNHTPPSMERSSTPLSEEGEAQQQKKPKTSRYLREVDRRAILLRIEQGEKQSVLAKEYDVSRAAICNLYKHREEVLSRTDQNPLAKHPKKPRPKSFLRKNSSTTITCIENSSGMKSSIHEVKTQAMNLLLTSMLNQRTCFDQASKSCLRAMRLLMEETLALVQLKSLEIMTLMGETCEGIQMENTPVFLSMEEKEFPSSKVFKEVQETTDTTSIGYCKTTTEPQTQTQTESYMIMWDEDTKTNKKKPISLEGLNVILFQLVTSANGQDLCQMIQHLLTQGASQKMMYIVVMFTCSEAVSSVHLQFPQVKVITARIDPSFSSGQPIRNRFSSSSFSSTSSSTPAATTTTITSPTPMKKDKEEGERGEIEKEAEEEEMDESEDRVPHDEVPQVDELVVEEMCVDKP